MEDDQVRLGELLKSHDELHIVCKLLWSIIEENGLQEELRKSLNDAKIQEGFAARATETELLYRRERLMLMASGAIQ